MKRFFALILVVTVIMSTVSAQALEIPSSASEFLLPEDRASFQVSLKVDELYPYGKEMLEALNLLLPHLALSAEIDSEESCFSILVDNDPIVSFAETTQDGQSVMTTETLPNRVLVSFADAFSALLGEEEEAACDFSLSRAVSEGLSAGKKLAETLLPYAESKSANYSIKKVGKAKWVRLAKLTKDQSEEIYDDLFAVITCGLSEEYVQSLEGLVFQKSLTAAAYYDAEDGQLMCVYLKGNVKHPNGKTYALSYQYAFLDGNISYKLELGKGKRGGVSLSGTLSVTNSGNQYSCTMKSQSSFKALDGKTVWEYTDTAELNGSSESGARTLKGSLVHEESVDTDDQDTSSGITIEIDLKAEEEQLIGEAELSITSGKNTITDVVLTFEPHEGQTASGETSAVNAETADTEDEDSSVSITMLGEEPEDESTEETSGEAETSDTESSEYLVGAAPTGMQNYTAPSEMQTIRLDALSDEELELLQDELFQNTAAQLLNAIFALVPMEDLQLFSDNTNMEDFTAFLEKWYSVQ